jgi:molecular chaperone GrpE (heat shock protein)
MSQTHAGKSGSNKSKARKRPAARQATEAVRDTRGDAPLIQGVEKIDSDRLAKALSTQITYGGAGVATSARTAVAEPADDRLEEIADDMLRLMQCVKAVQDAVAGLQARMDQMEQTIQASSRAYAHEIHTMRTSLVGERKASAALTTLGAVAGWMDSLSEMRDRLTSQKDAKLRNQLDAVLDRSIMMLRTLGFEEFQVCEGDPFDPARMECVGYADGLPGIVLTARRPGYHASGKIVRPAGVVIADPRSGISSEQDR